VCYLNWSVASKKCTEPVRRAHAFRDKEIRDPQKAGEKSPAFYYFQSNGRFMYLGIDVGSTTVKVSLLKNSSEIFSHYERHNACQFEVVLRLLHQISDSYPNENFSLAFSGSGGSVFADTLAQPFVQEVVANAKAIQALYPQCQTALELGGQDAKVILFKPDSQTGQLFVSDMRMNGACAGGTGAFLDQIAEILNIPVEEINNLAKKGNKIYDISGRCGVFAKTDIQPLLNQGVAKADIALSAFHALVNQTIGGLAQGVDLKGPLIFEGGPLAYNSVLRDVFCQKLNLSAKHIIFPANSTCLISLGTALCLPQLFPDAPKVQLSTVLTLLQRAREAYFASSDQNKFVFFKDAHERSDFFKRHSWPDQPIHLFSGNLPVYIGVDAGSTTSKMVLLSEKGELIDSFYENNQGEPFEVIRRGLLGFYDKYNALGVQLQVQGLGTTGYGEALFAQALHADYHTVETVAHARAAQKIEPEVSFVLDIGGQDMKAISLQQGVITQIILNEACSAGCGSFIETFSKSLGIPVESIAQAAFNSRSPAKLGSRCTVFMNSSIITEQRNGKTPEDIMAGLCHSVIENVFTKVIRSTNTSFLGDKIVVQGGTFKNDAVLRALELYTGKKVIRPQHPGLMGAIGVALLTQESVAEKILTAAYTSSFPGFDAIRSLTFTRDNSNSCPLCINVCQRTLIKFSDNTVFVSGNRCEKGAFVEPDNSPSLPVKKAKPVPNMVKYYNQLLVQDYNPPILRPSQNIRIGLPRVLDYWQNLPYWKTLLQALGYTVVVSGKSSRAQYEAGIKNIPSDTICFPAKLVHGHILELSQKKVDRILFPMILGRLKDESSQSSHMVCPILQGYPLVIDKTERAQAEGKIAFDIPVFDWKNRDLMVIQVTEYLSQTLKVPQKMALKAIAAGEKALADFQAALQTKSQQILSQLGPQDVAVVLAGRPYQYDEFVNHNLSSLFTQMGVPVLTLDAVDHDEFDIHNARIDFKNVFHARLLSASLAVCNHPQLELVQIVSFGCGHDAVFSDEMTRILTDHSKKSVLQLKLDEGEVKGPLSLRIRSFLETIKQRRQAGPTHTQIKELPHAYPQKFVKEDKQKRVILAPNLSVSFTLLVSKIIGKYGYTVEQVPLANDYAVELGKKYVNNDICFPAQINIGELLAYLSKTPLPQSSLAIGLAKNCDNCRAGQYAALARKALDECGFEQVPIVTTGDDNKDMHPGFKLGMGFQINMVWGLALIDSLETLVRATRPYETKAGEAQATYQYYLEAITTQVPVNKKKALNLFQECIHKFNQIDTKRSMRRPRVAVLGEILAKFHPRGNGYLEEYLEKNGMEVILPGMIDFFRRDDIVRKNKRQRNMMAKPVQAWLTGLISEKVYKYVLDRVNPIFREFKYYEHHGNAYELAEHINGLIDLAFKVGEGWLIAAEIIDQAKQGVNSFVIVQPFGCLPNHISGRGMSKMLKDMFPRIQILSLDYDPDTSIANVENRLQMLIMTARELEEPQAIKSLKLG